MSKKRVIYNGVKVSEEWPAKIESAQLLTHYTIAGQKYLRIRFGDEGHAGWGEKPCLGCAVLKGQFHVPDCEHEKCPACGESRAGGCECDTEELREQDEQQIAPARQSSFARWFVRVFGCFLILLLGFVVWTIFLVIGR